MTISPSTKQGMAKPNNPTVYVNLIEISHPRWGSPFRLCDHNTDIVHGGNTYTSWAFLMPLISEVPNDSPQPVLVLDNVVSTIAAAVKQAVGSRNRIQVIHKLVTYDAPDTIERGPVTYKIKAVHVTIFQLTAQLVSKGFEFDAIPRKKIDPTNFPIAFGKIR